jgi:hypothetical protein
LTQPMPGKKSINRCSKKSGDAMRPPAPAPSRGWVGVEIERSAPALRAHTSQREAGKHASLCEAMRSSRSVIYTPEALHFLEGPHIWLPPTAPHLVSALSAWLRGKSRFFFLSRVLYKSIIRGLPLPPRLAGGWASRLSGRPPRYALTRRKGRPASMLHFVKQCEAREA